MTTIIIFCTAVLCVLRLIRTASARRVKSCVITSTLAHFAVSRECRVIVRAPLRLAKREIDRFVFEHADWIARALAHQRTLAEAHPEPDEARARALAERAVREIPPKVRHYSAIMGLRPTGIRITSARTRFGSCSGKNSLCFSWRLMEYPEEAVDYVVVHELAHIVHKNHGPDFWALVGQYMPDYKRRRALLRK